MTTPTKSETDRPWLILPGTTIGGQVGIFSKPLTVYNPDRTELRDLDGVVDTGAIHSIVPARILEALDIPIYESQPYRLADGSIVQLPIGFSPVGLEGRVLVVPLLFGADPRQVLIGATTLEIFGYAADPRHQRLIPATLTL